MWNVSSEEYEENRSFASLRIVDLSSLQHFAVLVPPGCFSPCLSIFRFSPASIILSCLSQDRSVFSVFQCVIIMAVDSQVTAFFTPCAQFWCLFPTHCSMGLAVIPFQSSWGVIEWLRLRNPKYCIYYAKDAFQQELVHVRGSGTLL